MQHLPERYRIQLGRWFQSGQELTVGQWQKIALSRAFMRERVDILVLDEPTAAMDAEAGAGGVSAPSEPGHGSDGHHDLAPILDRAHGG